MDEKDILDILITVGIFAFSAIIGLVSEKRKKRNSAPRPASGPASGPAKRSAAPSTVARPVRPVVTQASAAPAVDVQPAAPSKMEGSDYHFDASEEGGCSIPGQHPAPEAPASMQPVTEEAEQGPLSEDERRDLLRTIIIGEALARKF